MKWRKLGGVGGVKKIEKGVVLVIGGGYVWRKGGESVTVAFLNEDWVMIIRRPEVKVGDRFFDNDWLERTEQSRHLSVVVENNPNPLVIAFDGDWGSGKSHFLKLWVGEHQRKYEKTTVIYFDAFKYDYLEDPLASMVIQLEEKLIKKNGDKKIDKLKWYFLRLVSVLRPLRPLISLFTSEVSNVAFAVYDMLSAIPKKQKNSSWQEEKKRIQSMEEFKSALSRLAQKQKLVFIVDELDRCRPDYALKMLEIIKHFFEVNNVHFILGANFTALESSVEATYGGGIDAAGYLKKFVNLRMQFLALESFENPSIVIRYFNRFEEYLEQEKHPLILRNFFGYSLLQQTKDILKIPSIAKKLRLRDIDRLFDRLAIFPKNYSYHDGHTYKNFLFLFAVVLEIIDRKLLDALIGANLDLQTIEELLSDDNSFAVQIKSFCYFLTTANLDNRQMDIIKENYPVFERKDRRYYRDKLRDELKKFLGEFDAFK